MGHPRRVATFHPGPGESREPSRKRLVLKDFGYCGRHGVRAPGGDQEAGILHRFRDPAHRRGDDRHTEGHGVEQHGSHALGGGGEDEELSRGDERQGIVEPPQEVDPVRDSELASRSFQMEPEGAVPGDGPVQVGNLHRREGGCAQQRVVILLPRERRHVDGKGGVGRKPVGLSDPCRGGGPGLCQVDGRGDDDDPGARDPAVFQDPPDRPGDGDDLPGPAPQEGATKGEGRPASGNPGASGKDGGEGRDREGVAVMGVQNGRLAAGFPPYRAERANREGLLPWNPGHPYPGLPEFRGEAAPVASNDNLLYSKTLQLTGEQEDLPLAAAPLPSRGHMNDAWQPLRHCRSESGNNGHRRSPKPATGALIPRSGTRPAPTWTPPSTGAPGMGGP